MPWEGCCARARGWRTRGASWELCALGPPRSPAAGHVCGAPVARCPSPMGVSVTEAGQLRSSNLWLPGRGGAGNQVPQDRRLEKTSPALILLEPIFFHSVETGPGCLCLRGTASDFKGR